MEEQVDNKNKRLSLSVFIVLMFKILPDAKIRSKDVFVGVLDTTLLFLVGQWGISLYIGIANVGTVYGAVAFMAILITWIYYSAIIIYRCGIYQIMGYRNRG